MKDEPVMPRRAFIRATATMAAATPAMASALSALGAEPTQHTPNHPADDATTLAEVPDMQDNKLTIERRGQVVLLGINRPAAQNRVDPDIFRALARAFHDCDHDPSLRAAVLFGHGIAPLAISVDNKEAVTLISKGEKVFRERFYYDPKQMRG